MKKTKTNSKTPLLAATVVFTSLLAITFAGLYVNERRSTIEPTTNVNLGAFEYTITNNKATKRTDQVVTNLKDFLKATAQTDIRQGCDKSYYNVIAVNEDETQVLLKYGCDSPNANMFAVREAQTWKTISPTNQFNALGTPLCSHVEQHNLSKAIAPVCFTSDGNSEIFTVRQ